VWDVDSIYKITTLLPAGTDGDLCFLRRVSSKAAAIFQHGTAGEGRENPLHAVRVGYGRQVSRAVGRLQIADEAMTFTAGIHTRTRVKMRVSRSEQIERRRPADCRIRTPE